MSARQITEVDLVLSPLTVRRWTSAEYERMFEAGILGPEDPVELIEGQVLVASPHTSAHGLAIQRCSEPLRILFGEGFCVRSKRPLALGDHSQPRPDLAVVKGSPKDYLATHPATAALVVEVADASLEHDRSTKANLYSSAAIPEYWILNLVEHCLEVHRDPTPDGYRTIRLQHAGDATSPVAGVGTSVRVDELVG